ncbi:MAG TPA: plastocyanin/azurin family copper-binding protein [Chthoniobacterales bacterium]|nr:plastocyanin/azurin family copper-binding protein [Chthoniobacterales bacterium]
MKNPLCALFMVPVVAIAVAGCSKSREADLKLVKIIGNDEMKFDVTSFEAKPGQKVTVTLTSIGKLPKEAMAHNWVLLEKGTDAAKLIAAGAAHAETDYIPADQATNVLFKTKLLGQGESDSITFTAPSQPGTYDYICTFPGHYAAGMKGVMTITPPAN